MNDEKFPKERRVVVITAVLFLHLILVSTHIVLENQRTLLQNLVALVISPFQIGFQKTVDYISFEMKHYVLLKKSFERYNDLREKYVRLIRENYALKRKMIDQDFVENLKSTRSEFIQADVISIDRNYPYGSLFIDKGSEDGIKKDMIVLNETGELVGKIVEPVSLFSSKVRLVTSPIGGIGAYIEKNKLEGLLRGNDSKSCSFEYLIENKPVKIGDRVITSGTDRIFPPYIPIGKVMSVEKDYLTQKVVVEPFYIKKTLKQLIVISNEIAIDHPIQEELPKPDAKKN